MFFRKTCFFSIKYPDKTEKMMDQNSFMAVCIIKFLMPRYFGQIIT